MPDLPLLGAAMPLSVLQDLRDWIISDQRDLELQDFTEAETLNGDCSDLIAQAKTLLDGYSGRLGIHGPFWGLSLANMDPDIRAIVTRRHLQGLEICERLGATQMVVHSPYTTWDYNNLDNYPGAREELVARALDTMTVVVERAEQIGVTLVIENIEDIDPDARCRLADEFHSNAVAVSVDTGHAHYAHGSNGAPPVDYFIGRAGRQLQHIHLQDADGYADRHWRIGTGSIHWHAVFKAIARLEQSPRLILELRDHADILPAATWLQDQGLAR